MYFNMNGTIVFFLGLIVNAFITRTNLRYIIAFLNQIRTYQKHIRYIYINMRYAYPFIHRLYNIIN